MTAKQDKKPVYKVGKAIRESYVVYDSENKVVSMEYSTLNEACRNLAMHIYKEREPDLIILANDRYCPNNQKSRLKIKKLASRIQSEFLRKEKKKRSFDKAYYHVNCLFAQAGVSTDKYTTEQIGEITAIILDKIKSNEFYKLIDFKPLDK